MKVIDLLNKIANREEVPEKIRIYNRNDSVYIWKPIENSSLYHYFNIATGERLGSDWRLDGRLLTEEIEIIEEDKEIEEIKIGMGLTEVDCAYKINELVKAVNKLKKGK